MAHKDQYPLEGLSYVLSTYRMSVCRPFQSRWLFETAFIGLLDGCVPYRSEWGHDLNAKISELGYS